MSIDARDQLEYFHIVIRNVSKLTKKIDVIVDRNLPERSVKDKIAPYNKGNEFLFKGGRIDPEYVELFSIIKTQKFMAASKGVFICGALNEGTSFETILAALHAEDVTELFVNQQLKPKITPVPEQNMVASQNKNIFIVHGRDQEPMKELKALLLNWAIIL
jgi:hypothetical protein